MLFDRHLSVDWAKRMRHPETWDGIQTVDDAELWETQQVLKARLIDFVRRRLAAQARRRDEGEAAVRRAAQVLDLDALTIGFARRFATYKRAGLVLQDVERLAELVHAADRPIQFIFAGKAHPEDHLGKELIQGIVRLTRRERVRAPDRLRRRLRHERGPAPRAGGRRLAEQPAPAAGGQRHLRARRPCSTAALNFSILDGWWAEAYDGTNGFAIGTGQTHTVPSVQDERDHKALVETLTEQVVPLYYDARRDRACPGAGSPARRTRCGRWPGGSTPTGW